MSVMQQHIHTHAQYAAASRVLEQRDVGWTDQRVRNGRNAGCVKSLHAETQPAQPVLQRARRRHRLRPACRLRIGIIEDCLFEQDAVETAGRIVSELSAGRGRGGFVDRAELERLGVDDTPMPRYLQHHDGMLATDFIEIPSGENAALRHLRVVVTAAAQPCARGRPVARDAKFLLDLRERANRIYGKIDV